MAGLITGREGPAGAAYHSNTHNHFGVAPDSRLISIKVADAKGLTDVTQVIAAIDWVIAHRNDAGMNIRVLSLSFGTDGTQTYLLDPLSFAVERAWKRGIVVVAAAGNTGFGDPSLNNPAFNPFVIAVGATDTKGTKSISDDVVPSWSTTGNILRNPDVVAPGTSVVSYRNRMSYIDKHHKTGRIGRRYFKGSGTSQATARPGKEGSHRNRDPAAQGKLARAGSRAAQSSSRQHLFVVLPFGPAAPPRHRPREPARSARLEHHFFVRPASGRPERHLRPALAGGNDHESRQQPSRDLQRHPSLGPGLRHRFGSRARLGLRWVGAERLGGQPLDRRILDGKPLDRQPLDRQQVDRQQVDRQPVDGR